MYHHGGDVPSIFHLFFYVLQRPESDLPRQLIRTTWRHRGKSSNSPGDGHRWSIQRVVFGVFGRNEEIDFLGYVFGRT